MIEKNAEVKLVRLNTGEDIIGNCLFDDENFILIIDSPMKIMIQRGVDYGKSMLLMMPWLPLEIVDENIASINYDDILTTVNPKDKFIEFYYSTLEKYIELAKTEENSLNEMFANDDEDEMSDELLEEIILSMRESKNRSIH
jgi:hypothetical protein